MTEKLNFLLNQRKLNGNLEVLDNSPHSSARYRISRKFDRAFDNGNETEWDLMFQEPDLFDDGM